TASAIFAFAIATAAALAAMTPALPVDDPLSERLPAVSTIARLDEPATAEDGQLIALLAKGGQKPKTWEGDLVSERSRWALRRVRQGKVLQPMREALDDRDWRVRAYAAWALAQVGDRQAVPRLITLLADRVWRMRAMAAFALHASGDRRALNAMLNARRDPAWQVRTEVAGYLGDLRDANLQPVLKEMMTDRHIAVRSAAEEAVRE